MLQHRPGLVGYLWGACVFTSELIKPNHIVLLQEGLWVDSTHLIDDVACIPLDLYPPFSSEPDVLGTGAIIENGAF